MQKQKVTKPKSGIESDKTKNICLGPLPPLIDPSLLRTASGYLVIRQLSRSLTAYDQSGQLVGDLAEKWEFASDFRSIRFWLRTNTKWSDGTDLTAHHLENSLVWIKAQGTAVHFETSQLTSISSEGPILSLEFSRPMPNFLHSASHPEFSAYRIVDNKVDLRYTVGPYTLFSDTEDQLTLRANTHFPNVEKFAIDSFQLPRFKSNAEALAALEQNKCDLAFIRTLTTEFEETLARKNSHLYRHPVSIGFTFFASLNPTRLELNERALLSNAIRKIADQAIDQFSDYDLAHQLFLNGGPGRMTNEETEGVWQALENLSQTRRWSRPSIEILAPGKYTFGNMLASGLEKVGIRSKLTFFNNQDEFAAAMEKNSFDIYVNNNDFSSIDLAENLQVTFNSARPLVSLGKERAYFAKLLANLELSDGILRSELTHKTGRELIERALVVPLFHMSYSIYHKRNFETAQFSRVGFEFPIHKVTLRESSQ